MHSSTSNFERTIPAIAWKTVFIATVITAGLITLAWELYARSQGYRPTLNDSFALWADERDKLQDDSLVLLGASRMLFDLDLDILEEGLGQKPLQLAFTGSSFYPMLEDLANEESFKGTIIIGVVPPMLPVPGGPLIERPQEALRVWQKSSIAESMGQDIALFLEEHIAFLKQEDLTLSVLLGKLPIPNRPNAALMPPMPPYFGVVERNRRYRMTEAAATPGELQSHIQQVWIPWFSPPPPPSFVDPEVFMQKMMKDGEAHFKNIVNLVRGLKNKGCKVVFLRLPSTGGVRELERLGAPRERVWDPLLQLTQSPGIHFEDHAELASFDCPEWSHLSNEDSIDFTRRLIPYLKNALK
ncbi:MAG: hypothetical protein ACI92G_004485 [Candidatus Pelagisphaera sp.]|jgi:hypothetical protein